MSIPVVAMSIALFRSAPPVIQFSLRLTHPAKFAPKLKELLHSSHCLIFDTTLLSTRSSRTRVWICLSVRAEYYYSRGQCSEASFDANAANTSLLIRRD